MQKIQVGEQKVEYIRHVISKKKMTTDSKKIEKLSSTWIIERTKEVSLVSLLL